MSEVISRVARQVGVPEWWVESVAVEYLDCRAFATSGALWEFRFDRLTDAELVDAVTRHRVVMRGYLLHNVWPSFVVGNTIRALVGSYNEPPAYGPGDILPEGRVSEHCFMDGGNALDVQDPKLQVPLGFFQVRDDDAFWQWQFIPFSSGAERKSSIVDIEPLIELEAEVSRLSSAKARSVALDGTPFADRVKLLYNKAEELRGPIREALWQYHLKMKQTVSDDKVVHGPPPRLSFMETLRVRSGEIETQFAAEPVFYRACLGFVATAYTCKELDVFHEKRAGAIIMAAACLEAYINGVLDRSHSDLFRDTERLPFPSKWHLLLTLHNQQDRWDVSAEPIKTLRRLQASRNELMHYKRGFRPVIRENEKVLSHLDGRVLEESMVFSLPARIRELVTIASNATGVSPPHWLQDSPAWELPHVPKDTQPAIRQERYTPRGALTMKVTGTIGKADANADGRETGPQK